MTEIQLSFLLGGAIVFFGLYALGWVLSPAGESTRKEAVGHLVVIGLTVEDDPGNRIFYDADTSGGEGPFVVYLEARYAYFAFPTFDAAYAVFANPGRSDG